MIDLRLLKRIVMYEQQLLSRTVQNDCESSLWRVAQIVFFLFQITFMLCAENNNNNHTIKKKSALFHVLTAVLIKIHVLRVYHLAR